MLYVTPLSGTRGTTQSGLTPQKAREKQSLQEFERFFLYQMLQEMRKTVHKTGFISNKSNESFYEEMLDDTMAGEMSKSGQLGLAKQMELELARAARSNPLPSNRVEGLPLHPVRAFSVKTAQPALSLEPLRRRDYALPAREPQGIPLNKHNTAAALAR